jgi:hypothetical protein
MSFEVPRPSIPTRCTRVSFAHQPFGFFSGNEGGRPALTGMQRKLRPSIKISPRKPRWRVRQADEDEVDETLLGLGTEKDGSIGK